MSERFERIENTVRQQIDRGNFSGIEWLVLRGGETWSRGKLGWADAQAGTPMPESPIYRIFSMTKPVVSTAALMAMERGLLRLFDPVALYLPDFGDMRILNADGSETPAEIPITVEHLMTHRAGFSYAFLPDCPVGAIYRTSQVDAAGEPLSAFIDKLSQLPLAFEPGSQWRYSVAIDVLARILEIVTDTPLPDLLRDWILDPLGLRDTAYTVPEENRHRLMAMFGKDDFDTILDFEPGPQKLTPADVSDRCPLDDPEFSRGGYGLYSTIDNYSVIARFLATGRAPDGGRLLSRKTVELMWANRIPPSQLPMRIGPIQFPGYGHGLTGRVMIDLGRALGLTSLGEIGWAGAAATYFWIDPREDLVGITMAQYLGSKVALGDEIRRAVYQALDD